MAINQTASIVALAKSLLMSLDRNSPTTSLPTPTVQLLLNLLIELGTQGNPIADKIAAKQAAFVASRVSGVERR